MPARLRAGWGKQVTEVVNIFVETFFECMSIVTEDRKKQYLSTKLQIQNVDNFLSFSISLEERRVVIQVALRAANRSRQKYVFKNDHYSVNKKKKNKLPKKKNALTKTVTD